MERDVPRAVFPRLTIMSRMSNEGERQRPPTRAGPHGERPGGAGLQAQGHVEPSVMIYAENSAQIPTYSDGIMLDVNACKRKKEEK